MSTKSIGRFSASDEVELQEDAPTKRGPTIPFGSVVKIIEQTGDTTIVEWNDGQHEIDDSTEVRPYVEPMESLIAVT